MPLFHVHSSHRARAFTLIEMLVVVGIIAVLVAITLVVGNQVMTGGKQRVAQDVIRVLDKAVQQYATSNNGENPSPLYKYKSPTSQTVMIPIADARDMAHTSSAVSAPALPGHQMINSVGLFYEQVRVVPECRAVLDTLPSRFVKEFDPDNDGSDQPSLLTVMDPWGRPYRYVHPVFQGVMTGDVGAAGAQPDTASRAVANMLPPLTPPATYAIDQIRRNYKATGTGAAAENRADSDGGTCVGARPYFYSAGPDGLVGGADNADNVYTTVPTLPKK